MLTTEKKRKIELALQKYSRSDLEWVGNLVEALLTSSTGIRYYTNTTPQDSRQGMDSLKEFFAGAARQH